MNSTRKLMVLVATVALLGACSSDDDEAPPPPPPPDPLATVPDSARQSTDGLVNYLKVLSQQPSDTREPVSLDGVTLPISDTAEPAPV